MKEEKEYLLIRNPYSEILTSNIIVLNKNLTIKKKPSKKILNKRKLIKQAKKQQRK